MALWALWGSPREEGVSKQRKGGRRQFEIHTLDFKLQTLELRCHLTPES
jgi:hypothetical protein